MIMNTNDVFFLTFFIIVLILLGILLFRNFLKSKSSIKRIQKDLKIYYDKDFKECIDILSKRLVKDEFEKVCLVLCNLRSGYDYGFNDSIDYAFYKEINKIRNHSNNKKIPKIVSFNKK